LKLEELKQRSKEASETDNFMQTIIKFLLLTMVLQTIKSRVYLVIHALFGLIFVKQIMISEARVVVRRRLHLPLVPPDFFCCYLMSHKTLRNEKRVRFCFFSFVNLRGQWIRI